MSKLKKETCLCARTSSCSCFHPGETTFCVQISESELYKINPGNIYFYAVQRSSWMKLRTVWHRWQAVSLFWAVTFCCQMPLSAQETIDNNFGGSLGISFAFGSTVNRIGVAANLFYFEDLIQANASLRLFYNLRTFGPPKRSRELQASLGAVGAWGENKGEYDLFLSPVSNQTGYRYSAGYAYLFYLDNKQTTQPAGMIGLQADQWQAIHENDILAGTGDDRFRTGGLMLAYQQEELRFALTYIGWTGDPKTPQARLVRDSDYHARRGYKDLSASTHGKYSHGILALQAEGLLDLGQVWRANLGIDAEQVRHFMQNKFMHDMITGGYHYPMLDEEGKPYLLKEEQKVRPVKLFYEGMLNAPPFY